MNQVRSQGYNQGGCDDSAYGRAYCKRAGILPIVYVAQIVYTNESMAQVNHTSVQVSVLEDVDQITRANRLSGPPNQLTLYNFQVGAYEWSIYNHMCKTV